MTQSSPLPIMRAKEVVHLDGGALKNMKDDSIITGAIAVPWAKFIVDSVDPALGIDTSVEMSYVISDKEVYPNGPRPRFYVRPDAPGNKRFLISDSFYVATFASRPAAATWPGLKIMIGDFGNAVAVSDGTDYVSVNARQYVYSEINGTLAIPTKTSTASATNYVFTTGAPNVPANLIVPGKTIMRFNYTFQRRGTGGTCDLAIKIGTVGDSSDRNITYHSAVAATNNRQVRGSSKLTCVASNYFHSSVQQGDTGDGANLLQQMGTTQFDTAQQMIVSVRAPVINAADSIDLIDFAWLWER